MIRLLVVEVRRACARGITRLLTLLGVVLIVAVGILIYRGARIANEPVRHQERIEACVRQYQAQAGTTDVRAMCAENIDGPDGRHRNSFGMTMLWPDLRAGAMGPISFGGDALFVLGRGVVMPAILLLILGGLVGGASMVGAEWQAGSFVALLTWEPRRVRLLLARLLATAVVGAVITVLLIALFTAVLVPTASFNGQMPDDPGWWVTYARAVLGLSALVGLTAAVGGALAMIGRRTVLAVFAVFGYLIAGEIVARNYWEPSRPYLLLHNLALVIGGEGFIPDGGSRWTGLAGLGVWSGLIIGLALVLFSRRDFATGA